MRPAVRCEPQEPLRDAAFPFPPLQWITSHIHVRHGMGLLHVLHTASLEILKIKNVANHKYLKSPGAGICTVFKQRFLFWYPFFSATATCLLQSFFLFVWGFFLWVFFLPFPFSVNGKFHIALAQQKQNITNSICPAVQAGGEIQPLLTSVPPLSAFLLLWILPRCVKIWWHEGWLCSEVTLCICTGTAPKWGDFSLLSTQKVQDSVCCLPCWSVLSQRLQPLHCWSSLPRGPSEGCGNLFPVFNPRGSGGCAVEEAAFSSAIPQINGDKWCMLQHHSKQCEFKLFLNSLGRLANDPGKGGQSSSWIFSD